MKLLIVFLAVVVAHRPAASAAVLRLRLDGDVVGTAAVARGDGAPGNDLAVLLADDAQPAHRKVVWFKRTETPSGPKLVVAGNMPLGDDAVAFDVCRLVAGSSAETLVLITPAGLFKLNGEPLIKTETLFAYRQNDELPRVRVCFELAPGTPQVVLLPLVKGIGVYRQQPPFTLDATLPQLGELKVQGQPVRGSELRTTQRLTLRLELAEASVIDFDGDGRKDICLAGDDRIACYLQSAVGGFSAGRVRRQAFPVLSADERKDTSLRTNCHLVELSGDGRADLVIRKSHYGLSDMASTIFVYRQRDTGTFPAFPDQTLQRSGFFGFQDWVDLDGDGNVDLLAPVAALGWSELAGIALRKSATIEFVWYRNAGGGRFETEARPLHELSWPVDFKNLGNIVGSLPLWGTHLLTPPVQELVFFPGKKRVEVMRLSAASGALSLTSLKSFDAEIGSDTLPVDLNGDGVEELVLTDPRNPERARSLVYVEAQ